MTFRDGVTVVLNCSILLPSNKTSVDISRYYTLKTLLLSRNDKSRDGERQLEMGSTVRKDLTDDKDEMSVEVCQRKI
jgi:hypothetical protein